MAAGYLFDHHNIVAYYMASGIAVLGFISVCLAWKLYLRNDEELVLKNDPSFEIHEKPQNV